ncbi:(Na+)-NQR maturation NqrM [Vibrio sp.]|uniref:(Na+)-NQR maturation NqrM n=1 Tax=Vibrio viridaestus TaxID=2487322 RepID=A0A3N9TIC8_9VIBR|nr:(Na+)-NQR maturation NqrM [Vibrio viridaestus]MDC0610718.1 (Na+)-NQR maturation NqrM [Vibrio sp.]RQW63653.1 (Na+)-NQR maturation NqrM [Vibrio viridaestus]
MTILICFLIFLCVIVMMAIGVLMKRNAIQGSCGGLSSIDIERVCNCETVCEEHSQKLYQITEPEQKNN